MEDTDKNKTNLLPIFRTFSLLGLGLMLISLVISSVHDSTQVEMMRDWLFVVSAALPVIYLYTPKIESGLKEIYLPVGLAITVTGPMLVMYWPLAPISGTEALSLVMGMFRLFFPWIVCVVMIGWAYNQRAVWIFSAGVGVLNTILPNLLHQIPQTFFLNLITQNLVIMIATSLIGYLVGLLSSAEQARRRELVEANRQLTDYANTIENLTISRERNRMARELHDTLAHTLSGLAVQLETIKAVIDQDPEKGRSLLDNSLSATRSGLTETRQALQALRATPLDDLGLRGALIELGKEAVKRTGARMEFDLPEKALTMDSAIEQTVYRIAQESLANIVKHATADVMKISLKMDGYLQLKISDDGVGFDVEKQVNEGHLGIAGMKERAMMVNGDLTVVSQRGSSTQVTLTVPMENL